LRKGKFTPLIPLFPLPQMKKKQEFWILGIHPLPLCPKSKKEKEI